MSAAANEIINFTAADFILHASGADSKFDQLLKTRWKRAQTLDVFRYHVDEGTIESRVIDGRYKFIAQFNRERGALRRKPQATVSLKMPFQRELFNFTKTKAEELLFEYRIDAAPEVTTVLINNSPIEFANSLMVPQLHDCLPQVFTEHALFNAITLIALSGNKSFRMGFNSLGAQASVNHLHMHMYYLDFDLAAELLEPTDGCLLRDWPIKGFLFQVEEFTFAKFREVTKKIFAIIDHCFEIQLPHNLFLTRDRTGKRINIFLWPRQAEFGAKDDMELALAFCEFSGFFICKTKHDYENITEQICVDHVGSLDTRFDYLVKYVQNTLKFTD